MGDNSMQDLLFYITRKETLYSIGIVLIGGIVYLCCRKLIRRIIMKDEDKHRLSRKNKTYLKLFNNVLKYMLFLIVLILVLQINGVNVTSIVTSLGLLSVAVGFALQDALKDIIMGINIILDDYFSVGDVIKIGDVEGKVTEIGLKTTHMKDVNTNNIFVISNRNITEALKLSYFLDIDLPLPYEEDINDMEKLIEKMIKKIEKLDHVISVEYKGIQKFGSSAIYYKIRILSKNEFKKQIMRDAHCIMKRILDENQIRIPYQQIDIHSK